ncbi:MAG: AAA family ATPase [Christensenellales bacterium]|jgi:cytidylate kinase
MGNRVIFTINRQYGTGGHEIGERVAKELSIPFYDKEAISSAAQQANQMQDTVSLDDRAANSLLYALAMGRYAYGSYGSVTAPTMPMNDQLFILQSKVIKSVADRGSCVIVGRCAGYVLKDDPDMVSVFIYGDMQDRMRRVRDVYRIDAFRLEDFITKKDKQRANYFNFYTNLKWDDFSNYHLALNASCLGIERVVELLKAYQEIRSR